MEYRLVSELPMSKRPNSGYAQVIRDLLPGQAMFWPRTGKLCLLAFQAGVGANAKKAAGRKVHTRQDAEKDGIWVWLA